MLLEIITSILTFLIVSWLFMKRTYSYWERRGIDYIPAVFPFGSIKECLLLKKNIGLVFQEFYRKYPGKKYVGFYSPFSPALLALDTEIIRTVITKEFNSFHDNGFTALKDVDPVMAYNAFGERGLQKWKTCRGVLSPALTLSKLKIMSNDIIKCAGNFAKFVGTKCGETLDMRILTRTYTLDSVVSSAYGVESDSFFNSNQQITELSQGQLFSDGNETNYSSLSALFLPLANKIFRWRTMSKKLESSFLKIYKSVAEHRKRNNVVRSDITQHLINLNEKAEQENRKPLSDIEIASHGLTIFNDGVDSASLTLTNLIYEIASNSSIQDKLRNEITSSVQDLKDLDYDKVQSFEYLDMVVLESFRIHTPVPFLSRTCTQKIDLDGLKLSPGIKVYIPVLALHMDSKFYPEPEKFIPERFSKERRNEIDKFAYLPFGEGPRMCMGMRFAHIEIKIALIALLLKYKISLAEKTKLNVDNSSIFVLLYEGTVKAIFTPI